MTKRVAETRVERSWGQRWKAAGGCVRVAWRVEAVNELLRLARIAPLKPDGWATFATDLQGFWGAQSVAVCFDNGRIGRSSILARTPENKLLSSATAMEALALTQAGHPLQHVDADRIDVCFELKDGGRGAFSLTGMRRRLSPAEERELVSMLAVQVGKAMEAQLELQRWQREKEFFEDLVAASCSAWALVDANGKLLRSNERAEQCLLKSAPLMLSNGCVRLRANSGDPMASLVEDLAATGRTRILVAKIGIDMAMPIWLLPLPRALSKEAVGALAWDVPQPPPDSKHLMRLYGLTRTEAGLLVRLAMGRTHQEVARSLDIDQEELDHHLGQVIRKTAVGDEQDLIMAVWRSVDGAHRNPPGDC